MIFGKITYQVMVQESFLSDSLIIKRNFQSFIKHLVSIRKRYQALGSFSNPLKVTYKHALNNKRIFFFKRQKA